MTTLFESQRRYDAIMRAQLQARDRELARAKRALRLEAAKLTEERRRAEATVAELRAIREEFRGRGASKEAFVAIVALQRAERALGRVR